ncbi:MAG: family 16 glycosylhydrolase, partial [Propionicimonas sp.]
AGKTKPTVVEARIKFPRAKGMHGGVWIQSGGGPEIDMIESYGTRVTHVYHLKGASDQRGYKSMTKSAAWYKKAHTFKVAFTTSKITYYIDGKVTKKVTKAKLPASTHYFVVASLLSSDWEVSRINNATLPSSKMIVEWVKITQGS